MLLPLEIAFGGLASALHLSAWGIFSSPRGKQVRLTTMPRRAMSVVLALWLVPTGVALLGPSLAVAQEQAKPDELSRKAKTRVAPIYPDIARRMNIAGTVRLAVVVSPNGTVKSSKPVGGHPLLVNAAMDAIKRWKFEPAKTDSSGVVEFKFEPQN
jgi:TonB family protein